MTSRGGRGTVEDGRTRLRARAALAGQRAGEVVHGGPRSAAVRRRQGSVRTWSAPQTWIAPSCSGSRGLAGIDDVAAVAPVALGDRDDRPWKARVSVSPHAAIE